jgi:hypothetical protein
MSETTPQNLKNHGRFDPAFHFGLLPFLAINFIYSIIHMVRHFNPPNMWLVLMSVALIVLALKVRSYSLKVQDRVIRLEERLRLQALSPIEWHAQVYHLSEDQLVGLRFAGDDEVVTLAKQALEEKLNRKQIKERVRNWRGDYWRV